MGLDARDISVNGFESSLDELRAKGFSLTIGPDDDRPLMTRVICRRDDEEIRFGTGPSTGGVRRVFVPLPAGFLSSTR